VAYDFFRKLKVASDHWLEYKETISSTTGKNECCKGGKVTEMVNFFFLLLLKSSPKRVTRVPKAGNQDWPIYITVILITDLRGAFNKF